MKRITTKLVMALLCAFSYGNVKAQLPNGSIAPDFTATDINGVSHNLYSLLNAGKTVVIDISATWCGPCWAYHQSGALENLYNQYGPSGTNEMYVFLVEGDGSTTLADLNGTGTNTQGNWVAGTPYPILDNADIANLYQVAYFPTVYVICPNRTLTLHDQETTAQLYAAKQACPPLTATANFIASNTTPCIGSTITLSDQSIGNPTSWSWSFSPNTVTFVGGTSSTSQNPQVQFNAAGPYTVILTINGTTGTDNEIKTSYITPNTTVLNLPLTENFEGTTFPPTNWKVENSDAPSIAWGTAGSKGLERRAATGNTGSTSGCVGYNCFNYADSSKVDNLISSTINLNGAASPKMTFKRSYKYYNSATNPTKYHDELKVFVSSDCGVTWGNAVYFKKGVQLATNGTINTTFSPAVAADWDMDTVNLSAFVGQNILIKFEFGNRYGNNIYLDDINIANTGTVTPSVSIASSIPNNTICSGSTVTFTATATNGGTPTYQWKVNGGNVGTNSSTYSTSSLTNGQIVTCIMTSSISGTTQVTSNAVTITVNQTPATPVVTSNSPVCSGNSIALQTPNLANATFAWTGPNSYSSSSQNATITNSTISMAGAYSLIVTTNGCSSTPSSSAVVVNPIVTPSATMAITSGGNPTCAAQSVTFTSSPISCGTTPTYQWQVNGVNVGSNSSIYTPTIINNNDVISCLITSNAVCSTVPTVNSNSITMQVTTSVTPSVSIASNTTSTICAGTSVTFTPTPGNGGDSPSYAWSVNGNLVSNNPIFTTSTLSNSSVISCIMTSNSACASVSTANSNSITINVSPLVTPTATISTVSNSICQGDIAEFLIVCALPGTMPVYQWQINGINVGVNSANFTSSALANGQTVTCILTSNVACATNSTVTSNAISMTVNPTPMFAVSSNTPICSGETVNLSSTNIPGATYAWSGPNSFSNSTQNPSFSNGTTLLNGTYSLVITQNGCSNTQTTNVTVNNTPEVPVVVLNGSTLTSSSTTGNQWYQNGVLIPNATSPNYTATSSGNYTVSTTLDGCTSTSAITIVDVNGIHEILVNKINLKIIPNPSTGISIIEINDPTIGEFEIEIKNIEGQLIERRIYSKQEVKFSTEINLSNKDKGVYFIQVKTGTKIEVYKLLLI
ncbi:MAG: T9SS type A sorting domain-containing protein [Flavobacteriia bacterium]|nr:T9SS type A sorting domain-containing protein [Flavobacteriia bacterium]